MMVKYEGLQIQNDAINNAEIVKFYDWVNAPIYAQSAEGKELVMNIFKQRRLNFEYECLTLEQYEELIK